MGKAFPCVLAVLLVSLLAPAAAGAIGTTPPLSIDRTIDEQYALPSSSELQVGAADSGDGVAIWRDAGDGPTPIKLALWRAGAASPAVTVDGLGTAPTVAMTPRGLAVASWVGSDGQLQIARRSPGGSFVRLPAVPVPLAGADSGLWGRPDVALRSDGSGTIAAATCRSFGGSTDVGSRTVDIGADGRTGAVEDPGTGVTGLDCSVLGRSELTAAVGPGGRAAVLDCALDGYCHIATRAGTAWTARGVDGTQYGAQTDDGSMTLTRAGKVVAAWQDTSTGNIDAAVGSDAATMTQLGVVSDGVRPAAYVDVAPFGTDALLTWVGTNPGGDTTVQTRPVFSGGSLGTTTTVAPHSAQTAAPLADPQVATWPDGTGVIAFADRPTAASIPRLALRTRALGGALAPLATTPLASRAVTLPRVALAGDGPTPLGLVATREAAGSDVANVVLRRIDGVAPALSIDVPTAASTESPTAMSATTSDTSGAVGVRWDFGDGSTADGATVTRRYADTATRTVTATATDLAGNRRTAIATVNVATPSPPGPTPTTTAPGTSPPGVTPTPRDTTAPTLSAARLTRTRFRAGTSNTATSARTARGTRLSLTLSEPARLSVEVVRVRKGRRKSGRCSTRSRRGASCTLRSTAKTLTRSLPAGAASVAFSARFSGRALRSGRYELVLTATDAAGNRSARRTLRFTLVSR